MFFQLDFYLMSSLKRISIITTILIFVTLIFLSYYTYISEFQSYNNQAEKEYETQGNLIKQVIRLKQKEALALALGLAELNFVKKAYGADSPEKGLTILRQNLPGYVSFLEKQMGYDQLKVHFHQPEAVSYFREWNQTGGDDLKFFRKSLMEVQNTGKPLMCIETGRGGLAFRGIAPVFVNNTFAGSVEVFFEFHEILPFLDNRSFDYIIISEKSVIEILFKEEFIKYAKYKLQNHIVIEDSFGPDRADMSSLVEKIEDRLDSRDRVLQSKSWTAGNLLLYDFSGNLMGHLLILFDKTEALNGIYTTITISFVLLFLMGFLQVFLIVYFFRKVDLSYKEIDVSKNRFFSIISHDLKSPLIGLIGLTDQLMKDKDISDEDQTTFFEVMHDASMKSLGLVENLLQWSNSQTGALILNPGPIPLRSATDEALGVLRINAENKQIKIQINMDPLLCVLADGDTFSVILRNLVSNALKFSPGGSVIKVNAVQENSEICIEVRDQGMGMDSNIKENLFTYKRETLRNGTDNETGSGLGLMLVKDFVKKNRGRIMVESSEGKGTVIRFWLPGVPAE